MKAWNKYRRKWKGILLTAIIASMSFSPAFVQDAWAMPDAGRAAENQVNVRETAVDGNINATLDADQEVTILEEMEASDGNIWYRISCSKNGQESSGWVRSDMLITSENEETPQEDPAESQEDPGEAEEVTEEEGEQPEEEVLSEEESEEEKAERSSVTFVFGDSTYAVVTDIPEDLEIPKHATQTVLTYEEKEIPVFQYGESDVLLFYMKKVGNDSDKRFFVFDAERNSIVPFVHVSGIVLLNKPVEEKVSAFYLECCCDFEAGSIPAYQSSQPTEYFNTDLVTDDFYYVYGVNKLGEKGWYCYDSVDGTIQRCITNLRYVKPEPEKEEAEPVAESNFLMDNLTYIMLAGIALFLIFWLVTFFRFKKYRKENEVNLDDVMDGESWLDKMDEVSLSHAVEQEKEAYKEAEKAAALENAKKEAEAERQKAEAEKQKAEEERRKAEAERQKKAAEKKKTEAEARQLEKSITTNMLEISEEVKAVLSGKKRMESEEISVTESKDDERETELEHAEPVIEPEDGEVESELELDGTIAELKDDDSVPASENFEEWLEEDEEPDYFDEPATEEEEEWLTHKLDFK